MKERGFWISRDSRYYFFSHKNPRITGGAMGVIWIEDFEKIFGLKCKKSEMLFIPTDKLKKIVKLVKK